MTILESVKTAICRARRHHESPQLVAVIMNLDDHSTLRQQLDPCSAVLEVSRLDIVVMGVPIRGLESVRPGRLILVADDRVEEEWIDTD